MRLLLVVTLLVGGLSAAFVAAVIWRARGPDAVQFQAGRIAFAGLIGGAAVVAVWLVYSLIVMFETMSHWGT